MIKEAICKLLGIERRDPPRKAKVCLFGHSTLVGFVEDEYLFGMHFVKVTTTQRQFYENDIGKEYLVNPSAIFSLEFLPVTDDIATREEAPSDPGDVVHDDLEVPF